MLDTIIITCLFLIGHLAELIKKLLPFVTMGAVTLIIYMACTGKIIINMQPQ